MGWLLVALVGLSQLCVAWYWRAVVHDAAARAASAGAALDAGPDECVATFVAALGAGAEAAGTHIGPPRCARTDDLFVVSTEWSMDPWLPLWPTLEGTVAVPAVVERIPGEETGDGR